MAESKISGDYGKVRYVDYTIPSREYAAGIFTHYEGSKSAPFGIPNTAKIIGVVNMDGGVGYRVSAYAINDYAAAGYLRVLIHNSTNTAITAELPIRIYYML